MKKIFYADLRTLALVRFTLGLLCFYEFARRIQLAEVFYSDAGIINRTVWFEKFHNYWKPSLLSINGTETYAIALLILGMILSTFYALGMRTRLANFFMWIILVSFQERFSISMNAGDVLLSLLLFWSFFLPMNAVASWDSAWHDPKEIPEDYKVTNVFSVGWIMLIFSLYFFTFLYKWHPDWFKEGTTLYYALNLDSFTTDFGHWMLNWPGLLKFLSISTLWLEGIGPWLLLLPFWTRGFRLLLILAFFGLHIGIGATMIIGTFWYTCLILWLFILPSEFWDFCSKYIYKYIPKKKYTVYYDKDCGFCRRMAHIFGSLLCVKNVEIKSSEEDPLVHKAILENNSWAGRAEGEKLNFHWSNFKELLAYSPFNALSFILQLIPLSVGDFFYNIVAKNRPFWTGVMRKVSYSNTRMRPGKVLTVVGLFFVVLSFLYNVEGVTERKYFKIGDTLTRVSRIFRINQKWSMFAPYPSRSEGWLVVDGRLRDGTRFDPWRNKKVDFRKPHNMADEFSNNIWRKTIGRIRKKNKEEYRLYLGRYICRKWNSEHDDDKKLETFEMYFMRDKTPPPGKKPYRVKKKKIWTHYCFSKSKT